MKVIENFLSKDKDAKQTFIALAHRIKLNEANWKKKYLSSLIETAFFYKDDYFFDNLIDIQIFLKSEDITRFEIYDHELRNAIKELERKGFLLKVSSGWKLSEYRITDLEKATNEWLNLEQKVKEDWLNNIGKKYDNVREDEKSLLWNKLIEKFIVKIFLRHGAETSKLIYKYSISDEEEFSDSCQKIMDITIQELPPNLRDIAKNEYPLFFDPDNSARRKYLIGLLDASLNQFAMAIPEESLRSVHTIASIELKLFLDTNFLFSALGLMEHHLNESVKEVLKLQQVISKISGGKIKIKFYYIRETLDEFKKTIDSSISKLNDIQLNRSIAKAAVKADKLSGLNLAYFKKVSESNVSISPQEFYKPYQDGAERLLREKGIEIYNCKELSFDNMRYDQTVIDDTYNFDEWLKASGKEREWETVERDVRLWHYIKNLRGNAFISATPLAPKFFILTLDYRFLGFDRQKQKSGNPLCLLPTQLLQMLSLFIPRTEDFEKAFITSIKIPTVKAVDPETEKVSLNILKAIAVYKDFSADIAVELLVDETLRVEVKGISDPENVRKVIEYTLSKKLEEERSKYEGDITKFRKNKDTIISQQTEKIAVLEKQVRELLKFKSEIEDAERLEVNNGNNKQMEKSKFLWFKPLSTSITKLFSFFAWLVNFAKNLLELIPKIWFW